MIGTIEADNQQVGELALALLAVFHESPLTPVMTAYVIGMAYKVYMQQTKEHSQIDLTTEEKDWMLRLIDEGMKNAKVVQMELPDGSFVVPGADQKKPH